MRERSEKNGFAHGGVGVGSELCHLMVSFEQPPEAVEMYLTEPRYDPGGGLSQVSKSASGAEAFAGVSSEDETVVV
jgi:hypothetical protein